MGMLFICWLIGICNMFDTKIRIGDDSIYIRAKNGLVTKYYKVR